MKKEKLSKIIEHIGKKYERAIEERDSIEPYMLFGPPGIGKTEGLKQMGKEIAKRNGYEFIDYQELQSARKDAIKEVEKIKEKGKEPFIFVDIPLSMTEPIDLMGIPQIINQDVSRVKYVPQEWAVLLSENAGILFLDEITNIQRDDIMSTTYKILGEKIIGNTKLNPKTLIISAGNNPEESSIARYLPQPVLNRMSIYNVEQDIESWKKVMRNRHKEINPIVIDYTAELLEEAKENAENEDQRQYLTPRSADYFLRKYKMTEKAYKENEITKEERMKEIEYDLQGTWGRNVQQQNKMKAFLDKIEVLNVVINGGDRKIIDKEIQNSNAIGLYGYSLITSSLMPKSYENITDSKKIENTKYLINKILGEDRKQINALASTYEIFKIKENSNIEPTELIEDYRENLHKLNIIDYMIGEKDKKELFDEKDRINQMNKMELAEHLINLRATEGKTNRIYEVYLTSKTTEYLNRYKRVLLSDKEIMSNDKIFEMSNTKNM